MWIQRQNLKSLVLLTTSTLMLVSEISKVAHASLPPLVRRQPIAMQQAWKEIEQIVLENEKLAVPLAEPYLSRGDLWCRIGGYEDALADYLKATELFFNGNPTPGEQARHLARLRTCLESAVAQPRPHFPSDAATEFDKGLTAFRAGDATIALSCFAECTRLMPDMPLYRVYHALALEQLNQSDDAKRQVAIALSLIRATGADAADQMALIHRALEPVQGRLRLWLAVQLEIAIKLPTLDRTSVVR